MNSLTELLTFIDVKSVKDHGVPIVREIVCRQKTEVPAVPSIEMKEKTS